MPIEQPYSTRTMQSDWRICATFIGVRHSAFLDSIHKKKAYQGRSSGGDASPALCLPCRAHSNKSLGSWLSGLGQYATTTHTARAAPPIIVAQCRHRKRSTPDWEQQGGAELEDDCRGDF